MTTIPQAQATTALRQSPQRAFRSRYDNSDRTGAVYCAAKCAMRDQVTYFVYGGNAFMVAVYRVTRKESEAMCRVNNHSDRYWSVAPDLSVTAHVFD